MKPSIKEIYAQYMGSLLVKCSEYNSADVLGHMFEQSFLSYEEFKSLLGRSDLDPKTISFLVGVNEGINAIHADLEARYCEAEPADSVSNVEAVMAAGESITELSEFSNEILRNATEATVESIKGAVALIISNEKDKFDSDKQAQVDGVTLLTDGDEEDDEANGEEEAAATDSDNGNDGEQGGAEGSGEENSGEGSDGGSGDEGQSEEDGGSGDNPFDEKVVSTAKESAEYGNLAMYNDDHRVIEVERPVEYIYNNVKDLIKNHEGTMNDIATLPEEEAIGRVKQLSDSIVEGVLVCAAFCTDLKLPVARLSIILERLRGQQ